MNSFLKFGQAVPEIFEFKCFKKRGFFKQNLEETYNLKWRQKETFLRLLSNFLGINTHKFVKNDPKFENKSLFDAKRYEA